MSSREVVLVRGYVSEEWAAEGLLLSGIMSMRGSIRDRKEATEAEQRCKEHT